MSVPSRHRTCLFPLGLALGLMACAAVHAATPAPPQAEWPGSGDASVDRHLEDINEYAARYPAAFADEMARYYSVPRAYVEAMMKQPDWSAGDIYMACAVAQVAGQPCRAVVREWSRDHAGGWRAVAERLDVRPGTAGYRRLRKGLDDTYRRWERPSP
jgi:hypothetical protein